jgi:hypothetical protein
MVEKKVRSGAIVSATALMRNEDAFIAVITPREKF